MSFERIYATYYKSVVGYMVRLRFTRAEAEELAQDVFRSVFKEIEAFRGGDMKSYVYTIARNIAFNEFRRRHTGGREGQEVPLENVPWLAESVATDGWTGHTPPSAEEKLAEQEQRSKRTAWLREGIEALPKDTAQCLKLWLEDFSYKEIMASTGLSEDAVKSRLHDARVRLKERLGDELEGGANDPKG